MKKAISLLLCLMLLTGCSAVPGEIKTGMELRSRLLQATACTFTADITADYGDSLHAFAMDCTCDSQGSITFTVTEPETISGISGRISGEGGSLTFDEAALHFDLLAEEQLSPISAPWILMKTLRSGYITSACTENNKILLSIDDSYEDNALRLDIWLNREGTPENADILYDGRRILSFSVENFKIL